MKLIDFLLKEGYFIYREVAETYLLSGQILVDGKRVTDGRTRVKDKALIQILDGSNTSFSTDGIKLSDAMQRLGIFATAKVCIDFIAGRGGVTEALIGGGASRVFAYYEDARTFSKGLLYSPFCTAQPVLLQRRSFDPLASIAMVKQQAAHARLAVIHGGKDGTRKLLPYFRDILSAGEIIWHIKPIKEIDLPIARRLGVIDERSYLPLLRQLIAEVNAVPGLALQNLCAADHTYYAGLPEFYLHLISGYGIQGFQIEDSVLKAIIAEAIANTKVNKHSFQNRFGGTPPEQEPPRRQEESVIPLNTYQPKKSLFGFLRRKKKQTPKEGKKE